MYLQSTIVDLNFFVTTIYPKGKTHLAILVLHEKQFFQVKTTSCAKKGYEIRWHNENYNKIRRLHR